jgi:mannose-6-phosphate isomerase-like protein (cupin superfamily)
MKPLGIHHHFADGVYAKEMRIPAGHWVTKHLHDYDHISILAQGVVVVEVDGESMFYKAPACITIPKNCNHKISAHTDSVWYCIHATDETDPGKVDQYLIKETV